MSDTTRDALLKAREALTNCNSKYGHRCNRCDSEIDEGGKVVAAIDAALAEQRGEPVAFLWQHDETGRTTLTMATDPHPGKRWHRIPLYLGPLQTKHKP